MERVIGIFSTYALAKYEIVTCSKASGLEPNYYTISGPFKINEIGKG